jgi:DnaJ family protein C protein 7
MDPSDETVRRHHEKAVFEVKKSKRPDYYAILGGGGRYSC